MEAKHIYIYLKPWTINDIKVRKTAKIRERYNQVPHLTQDTSWESNKNTINITNKSQEVSPFPAGDHKAAMKRRESMRNKRHKNTKYRQKKYRFGTVIKIILQEGLNSFTEPTSPLVQDYLLFELTNLHQNIAIINSSKCVSDLKCPFNTDSLDRKHSFNLLSSARSYNVNRSHEKSLHIIPVNTLLAAFIQEFSLPRQGDCKTRKNTK